MVDKTAREAGLQQLLNGAGYFTALWAANGTKTVGDVTLAVDNKLFKVPHDSFAFADWAIDERLVQRASIATVNILFFEQREFNAVVETAETLDLCCFAWFLVAELITRDAHNDKTLLLVLFIKCLKPIVLLGEATFTCNIHEKNNLAL